MVSPQRPIRHFRSALCVLACFAFLLAGCGSSNSDDPNDSTPTDSTSTSSATAEARTLAQRFLRYAYRGAMLSSTHPLNDSLQTLTSYSGLGSQVMLVDTFSVESVRTRNDSVFVAEVRFPRTLMVSSEWQASDPAVDVQRTLRIQSSKVASAPRIVGWTALQAHIQDVRPDQARATIQRLRKQFEQVRKEPEV